MKRTKQEKIFYYTMAGLYLKIINTLETLEEKICWLLKRYPKLRNSDRLLVFYYWIIADKFKGELVDETILKLTPAESITRIRRLIQNELNLFLPTEPTVREARDIAEKTWTEWIIKEKEMK